MTSLVRAFFCNDSHSLRNSPLEIDGEPEKYYKLNDTKVLDWLKRKVWLRKRETVLALIVDVQIDSFAGYLLTADPSIARSSAVASSLVRREEKVTEGT